ncbi:hypothetical protein HYX16_04475 [Candidatus Woesearchaeota archaeon]|nr:hypothetical protein [Candidatus Woesearchaeota archaeon]
MKKWLKDLEIFVDKTIPFLLVALIVVVIIDLFFNEIAEKFAFQIGIIDGVIVTFFVLDLGFKYHKARTIPEFLKKYWLEIIAIFPFYLILRAFELAIGFLEFSGLLKEGQSVFHAGIEIEKEIGLATKEARELSSVEKIGVRTRAFNSAFRFVRRAPRFAEAAQFYEDPKHKKEIKKFEKKKIRIVKEEIKKEEKNLKRVYKKLSK